jgi:hypothetical protein
MGFFTIIGFLAGVVSVFFIGRVLAWILEKVLHLEL